MSKEEHGWSEYWQASAAEGEVFVTGEGERHPALGGHWQEIFAALEPGCRVLDLAAGAGSVFAHLDEGHGLDLHAVDTAREALARLKRRLPGATVAVSSAARTPYEDRAFELVVSQFGVEYAGTAAFSEAARLVAPGGAFSALCHVRDGYIDSRTRACLEAANRLVESDFIGKAQALTEANFGTDRERQERTARAFITAERVVAQDVKTVTAGVHAHLYLGFRQLYERRRQYDSRDILDWLERMRGDVDRDIFRLSSMRAAALDEKDLEAAVHRLTGGGLEVTHRDPFRTREGEKAVAWDLRARRPSA